jgi:hypothetical protein
LCLILITAAPRTASRLIASLLDATPLDATQRSVHAIIPIAAPPRHSARLIATLRYAARRNATQRFLVHVIAHRRSATHRPAPQLDAPPRPAAQRNATFSFVPYSHHRAPHRDSALRCFTRRRSTPLDATQRSNFCHCPSPPHRRAVSPRPAPRRSSPPRSAPQRSATLLDASLRNATQRNDSFMPLDPSPLRNAPLRCSTRRHAAQLAAPQRHATSSMKRRTWKMPFDALPEGVVSDLVKLRIALDGVRNNWISGQFGLPDAETHCAIGWLLVATDWDRDEATRLALKYLYPVLPPKAQHPDRRLESIWNYNDRGSQARIIRLFTDAAGLAADAAG